MALVTNQAAMQDSARPRKPICNSHSLRFQISDLGVPGGTVEPGTRTRQTIVMMTMGPKTAMTMASHTGTVSCSV